jgi:hypothetical protein
LGNGVFNWYEQSFIDEEVSKVSHGDGYDAAIISVSGLNSIGNLIRAKTVDQIGPDCPAGTGKTIVGAGVQIYDNDLFIEDFVDNIWFIYPKRRHSSLQPARSNSISVITPVFNAQAYLADTLGAADKMGCRWRRNAILQWSETPSRGNAHPSP